MQPTRLEAQLCARYEGVAADAGLDASAMVTEAKAIVFGQLWKQQWWLPSFAELEGGRARLIERALSYLLLTGGDFQAAWTELRQELRPTYDKAYRQCGGGEILSLDWTFEGSTTEQYDIVRDDQHIEPSPSTSDPRLRELLVHLRDHERETMQMVADGLTVPEISDLIGVAEASIRSRLARARKRLRAMAEALDASSAA